MTILIFQQCFDYTYLNSKSSSKYQFGRLHILYNIKPNLSYRVRLVYYYNMVDSYISQLVLLTIKGIPVYLLDLILIHNDFIVLFGDILNAFIQANTIVKSTPVVVQNLANINMKLQFGCYSNWSPLVVHNS